MTALPPAREKRLQALHNRYIRVIDDGALEEWPDLFAPGGLYRIVTRENYHQGLPLSIMLCQGRGMMQDRVTGFRRINVYEPQRYCHQISGLEVERVDRDSIQCISNFLVIRTMQTGAASVFASGVYRDRVRFERDRALFMERTAIIDSRSIDTLLVIPL